MKHLKNLIYLFIMTLTLTGCYSAGSAMKTVTEFGDALKTWSENKFDAEYELDSDKYTSEQAPVHCELMSNLLKIYPIPTSLGTVETYDINDYKNKLSQWFEDDENVLLNLSDIKEPNKAELEMVEEYERIKDQFIVLEGNLTVKNYNKDIISHKEPYKELYYVRRFNSKIVKIEPRTYTDSGRIRIDFSDFEEQSTFGGSLNYSPNWPVSLSLSYSYYYLMFGIDGGYNPDSDKVVQEKLTMQNILSYQKKTVTYDPFGYVTCTPSLYLKYLSIGCGAGIMLSKKVVTPQPNKLVNPHISFMLRPNIKGYIPLNDEWFLTVNTSYDWGMAIKIKNGLSFGLGLQYRIY